MRASVNTYELFVDGASRGNPGKAGVGICVKKNGTVIIQEGFFLGITTNNTAEYTALAAGIFLLEQHERHTGDTADSIKIHSDSQLLVRQMQGFYQVKTPHIGKLKSFCQLLLSEKNYVIEHVRRENNAVADQLANRGIDKKYKLPEDFLEFAAQNDVKVD